MTTRTTTRAAGAAILAAAVMAGCATTVPVKDMLGDREAFLRTQYDPARLRPEVKAALDKAATPTPAFKSMKLSVRLANDDQGKKRDIEITSIVLNAGNGLFQRQDELSSNGFPYRVNNELNYMGLRALAWQSAFHNRSNSEMGYEVKQIAKLGGSLAAAKAGDELAYDVMTGSTMQMANYFAVKVTCKVGDTLPAGSVAAGLEGEAVKLTCTRYDDKGVAMSKTDNAYLKRYGFALLLEYSSSRSRDVYTYSKAEIRN